MNNKWDKWDKWGKYTILQQDERLIPYLPEMRWLTESNLWELLTQFQSVILKPAASSKGKGNIFIHSIGEGRYIFQTEMIQERIDAENLYLRIAEEILQDYVQYIEPRQFNSIFSQSYLVQRYFPLAKMDHRPFDIRVIVQRKEEDPWQVTGKLAKWANEGYSNPYSRSGSILLPLEEALQRSTLKQFPANTLASQIEEVSLLAAEQLARNYPERRIIGFDLCYDASENLWLLEVNFNPSDSLFLHFKDKSMYNRIQSFK